MSIACPDVMWNRLDSEKYSEAHLEDPSIDSQTEGGWRVSRPRYTRRPPRIFKLGFTDISDAEKNIIQGLFNDARGASEIISGWTNPISNEVLNVRFKRQSVPQYRYRGHGNNHRWDVSGVEFEEV